MAPLAQPTGSCLNPAMTSDLRVRLNWLEGHVRGVRGMLDNQVDCQQILIQVSAVRAAHNQVAIEMLDIYLDSCIAECAASGDKKALRQLQNVVTYILRL